MAQINVDMDNMPDQFLLVQDNGSRKNGLLCGKVYNEGRVKRHVKIKHSSILPVLLSNEPDIVENQDSETAPRRRRRGKKGKSLEIGSTSTPKVKSHEIGSTSTPTGRQYCVHCGWAITFGRSLKKLGLDGIWEHEGRGRFRELKPDILIMLMKLLGGLIHLIGEGFNVSTITTDNIVFFKDDIHYTNPQIIECTLGIAQQSTGTQLQTLATIIENEFTQGHPLIARESPSLASFLRCLRQDNCTARFAGKNSFGYQRENELLGHPVFLNNTQNCVYLVAVFDQMYTNTTFKPWWLDKTKILDTHRSLTWMAAVESPGPWEVLRNFY
ncbi:hypothetical protein MKW98_024176 [Papaver atlanticum]|uniref:Uncharacterized protein n=1 Tax=Papaver atlanticum TaxID=357466 RepID=A0AAD4T1H4_9MAGN|nr:hypothetical protein MKW98_024176 [Papaver atlanticum]